MWYVLTVSQHAGGRYIWLDLSLNSLLIRQHPQHQQNPKATRCGFARKINDSPDSTTNVCGHISDSALALRVRLSLRLYDYVLALQPLFTFVRYGFTRSNNIPSWSSQRASAGQTRYEASPVIISSLRREQRGELGNGASNVLDVVGLHHQP